MKKNMFLVAALLALMAAVLPAQTDDSGGTPGLKFTLPKGGTGYTVEKGKVKTGAVVIPESYNNLPVTAIAKKAFSSSTITGITIPVSVIDIGDQAFKDCKNLTEITIPASVITMGKGVFDSCNSLKSITISASITDIGDQTFKKCKTLTEITIPASVITMGKEVFDSCTSLKSITIPNSVTSISEESFKDCTSLTSVIIGNGVTNIRKQAFNGCTSLTNVTIGNGVTNIWHQAFKDCKSLTSITIPASVISIGTLSRGDKLALYIHDDTSAPYVFRGCESLTAINVDAGNTAYSSQDGVLYNKNKTILLCYPAGKKGAFTIPNGVTTIGSSAFVLCSLTSVTIPASVTSIDQEAFLGSAITSVTFHKWIGDDEWKVDTVRGKEYYNLKRDLFFYYFSSFGNDYYKSEAVVTFTRENNLSETWRIKR